MSSDDRLTNAERQSLAALDKPVLTQAELRAKYPGYWHGPAGVAADEWRQRAIAAESGRDAAQAEIRRLLALYPAGVTP